MEAEKELVQLLRSETCDHARCRELIGELGGCMCEITDGYGNKTTPMHLLIDYGHYDLALALIESSDATDWNAVPEGEAALLWELQYIDADFVTEREAAYAESEQKLRLVLALIRGGANPNPLVDGDHEPLLSYIRFELNEGSGNPHLWQMEHILEANAYGETECFFEKLARQPVTAIGMFAWGCWLLDDDLGECDHVLVSFEDGEVMLLSSCLVGQSEWDFYAVPVEKEVDRKRYHAVEPREGSIRLLRRYILDEDIPESHWLDLAIDDAVLRIHADASNLTVGIVAPDGVAWETVRRRVLFPEGE